MAELIEKEISQLKELVQEREGSARTLAGLNNRGQIVVKNRAYRRKHRTMAELNGLSRNYYTKKKTKKRTRNGKVKVIRKRK